MPELQGMTNRESFFTRKLLAWNEESNTREMPWKGEKDPYRIWLSEIMLQQTRVEQGTAYYERFIKAFPSVSKLATAPETKVFKLWEGLGYYSRCKNLLAAAKKIHIEYKDQFPHHYQDILDLPGIGPYTAAAIASFAFGLPYAVVDGNVLRVLSRYFGIDTAIDSTTGKKYFAVLAQRLLDKKAPGTYNQAIMDFGAVICKPRSPLCDECYLRRNCEAFVSGRVDLLPVKEKRIQKKERWLNYLVAEFEGKVYVKKRGPKDIWENLYEFILLETPQAVSEAELLLSPQAKAIFGKQPLQAWGRSPVYRQQLTHQTIHGRFYMLRLTRAPLLKDWETVRKRQLETLPFPRLISAWLKEGRPAAETQKGLGF